MAIKILIVDDITETRENIKRLLYFEKDMMVVGEASDGNEAIRQTQKLSPDIVLMDVNMPTLDGITATQEISLKYPKTAIIIMSVQGEQEYLKKAMVAGAREYMVKPFGTDELVDTIRRVCEFEKRRRINLTEPSVVKELQRDPQIITVFSTKGGVGKTSIATNLAVSLAEETRKKVVIMDLDLQFGDVAVMLNIIPKRTITEIIQDINQMDTDLLENYLISHPTGVKVLPSPTRPEYAELITGAHVEKILGVLKQSYDYIVIDTPHIFHDTTLMAMDLCHQILLVVSLDLPTIKNVKLGLEVLDSLHLKGKVKLILNRSANDMGIKHEDMEENLKMKIASHIPSDGRTVVSSVNKGDPFVMTHPGTKISESIRELSRMVMIGEAKQTRAAKIPEKKGLLGRVFG
ncbi:MAG: response regulator [Thermincola sp.]|jgi:pilus assembly protein CpaE|nr:response regulator [Thermincola sp.]MDT3703398.1 response regulator [Thermincola sp.]